MAGVELDARGELDAGQMSETGLRQVRKLVEDHGLRVSAVEFRTRRGYGNPDDLPRRVEATKAAMRMAYALGAGLVVNQIGRIPDDPESTDWKMMVEVLADLGRFGQHAGSLLLAETGSEDGPTLRKFVEALPTGSLGVALSPGNLVVNGFSPLEAVEVLGTDIHYVRATDGVRDMARGRGMEVILGRGSADFPALLAALGERSYSGYLCVERETSSDPQADLQQALEFLRNL